MSEINFKKKLKNNKPLSIPNLFPHFPTFASSKAKKLENKNIRVRFAPSPTGPLHIGGVRTALYNYLFAKKMNGTFILRIEDTDQTRYVEGAEQYIISSLEWLGLTPDEGPVFGGDYGPYRQSERKAMYAQYAEQLVAEGYAYYAFDSSEDLSRMREEQEKLGFHSAKYDRRTRLTMTNSLTLSGGELEEKMLNSPDKVIRLKMPENRIVSFEDKVRENVSFNTDELDDKVILKADGMPTYHLANIVDDHLMQISHVIRGEEWLSSTAHHVLMYEFLGWEAPVFTHLPLLLKPTGKGKLSKRDGAKFGFPVFPMQWQAEEELYAGFKEEGYDAQALLNFLVLLGWNPGNDQEIMSKEEMIQLFDLSQIVKSGARFDVDKVLWFNQQYIMSYSAEHILAVAKTSFPESVTSRYEDKYLLQAIEMMKPRVQRYGEFYSEAQYLFEAPEEYDGKQVQKRYKDDVPERFAAIHSLLENIEDWNAEVISAKVKGHLNDNGLKMGVYLPLLRIMMCGAMTGPDLFEMMELVGQGETSERFKSALSAFAKIVE